MKRLFFLLLLIAGIQISVLAQNHCPMNKKDFRSKQQTYLTEKAHLTPQEAEAFFPLYFELQDKKEQNNREAWKKIRRGKEEGVSDAEYEKLIEEIIQARIESDQLELEYLYKYKTILPVKKIYNIQRAEMRFHRELLRPHKNK